MQLSNPLPRWPTQCIHMDSGDELAQ
jgi:hypothetical protein